MPAHSSRFHACRRCGTCCDKGGPTLHLDDQARIDSGRIPARYLYTLRRGEMVHDAARGCLMPLQSEMIKIKGRHPAFTCIFWDPEGAACGIYEDRPLECRLLKCWKPQELLSVYGKDLLTRKQLLDGCPDLWQLVADHDRRCDVEAAGRLIRPESGAAEKDALRQMMAYDQSVRRLVVEKAGMDPGMLEFLFGRPLSDAVRGRLRIPGP